MTIQSRPHYGDRLGTTARGDVVVLDEQWQKFIDELVAAIDASVPGTTPTADGAANRDLSDGDRAAFVRMTRATANTVTLTAAVLAAAPAGAEWSGIQAGNGQTTIVAGVGVTLNATPGLKARTKFSVWTIKKVDDDEADVFGDLAA